MLCSFIWSCRPNIFTQLCKSSDKIFKRSLNYYIFAKGTQEMLCAGFWCFRNLHKPSTVLYSSVNNQLIKQSDILYKVHYFAVHVKHQTWNDPPTHIAPNMVKMLSKCLIAWIRMRRRVTRRLIRIQSVCIWLYSFE